MNTHTCISGEVIDYPDLAPNVAGFLDRVRAAVADPTVPVSDLLLLIYGDENPILDHDFVPGRAMVTRRVFENPVYRVLTDLIGVKQLNLGQLEPAKVDAAFTISVQDAATQLGLTPGAVRAAIVARKLAGHMRNGQWYTRPEAVAAYKVSTRGRKKSGAAPVNAMSRVVFRAGGVAGGSLSVRVAGRELTVTKHDDGTITGEVPPEWERAAVKTTTKSGVRVFELEPDPGGSEEVEHLGLFVRGPFRVVGRHNNTRAANAAWKVYGSTSAPAGT